MPLFPALLEDDYAPPTRSLTLPLGLPLALIALVVVLLVLRRRSR